MKYFPKLTGEKVYLSPVNPDDYEIYTKWMNDPAITDNTGQTHKIFGLEDEKKFLQDIRGTFAIVKQGTNELLGGISLEIDYPQHHRKATLGIFIGEKDNHGKGYGCEAIKLILDFAFNTLNLNNVMLEMFEFNTGAIKCYQKCGFKEIGRRRKSIFIRGEYHDAIFMDILAEEFKK